MLRRYFDSVGNWHRLSTKLPRSGIDVQKKGVEAVRPRNVVPGSKILLILRIHRNEKNPVTVL